MNDGFRLDLDSSFYLSEINASDVDSFVQWLNDPVLYANTLRIPSPYTMEDAEQFVQIVDESTAKQGHPIHFAIRDARDELIGGIGFEGLSYGHRAEIGYWLAKPFRGRGLMTLAVSAACEHAMGHWKLVRVEAHVFNHNDASARVLEKCGFEFEGLLRKYHKKDGQLIDSRLFALIRDAPHDSSKE